MEKEAMHILLHLKEVIYYILEILGIHLVMIHAGTNDLYPRLGKEILHAAEYHHAGMKGRSGKAEANHLHSSVMKLSEQNPHACFYISSCLPRFDDTRTLDPTKETQIAKFNNQLNHLCINYPRNNMQVVNYPD